MYRIVIVALTYIAFLTPHAAAERAMINGVELDYVVIGSGAPVYLLHGGMESRDSFENQIEPLARHFTVVALDSRKQGRSGSSGETISYELMSSDVQALATHLGHEEISIIGLSDGGITAIMTAINAPELIDQLVLLGATYHYNAYPDETRSFIANYRWDGSTDPEQYPGNFIKHYLTGHDDLSGFGALLEEMSTMWTTSPRLEPENLSSITARTLVINGDHEDVDLNHVLSMYQSLPDAQLFVVPDGTHYALSEHPDLVNKVILEFLTSER